MFSILTAVNITRYEKHRRVFLENFLTKIFNNFFRGKNFFYKKSFSPEPPFQKNFNIKNRSHRERFFFGGFILNVARSENFLQGLRRRSEKKLDNHHKKNYPYIKYFI